MRSGWIIFVFCLALAGCQNPNPCQDLMRENFELNEWILQQEILIDEQQRELNRLQAESDSLEDFEDEAGQIEPPNIDFGDPGGAPPFSRPGDPGVLNDEQVPPPPIQSGGGDDPQDDPLNQAEIILPGFEGDDAIFFEDQANVDQILIDPQATRAHNLDGRQGDDGLVVVIEPRDERNRPIAAAAALSIVAVDPAQPEHLSRVARWDYTAEEVRDLYVRTRQGPRLVCQLLWPETRPENSRLQLYVRMQADDEQSHVADVPLLADFAGAERGAIRQAEAGPRQRLREPTTAIEREFSHNTGANVPPEYRPLRRVTAPGKEPPTEEPRREQSDAAAQSSKQSTSDQSNDAGPIRTTRRAPPWSPIR